MINARLWHAQLLHGGDNPRPYSLPFLARTQVQFADQLGQTLELECVLIVVIAFDDLLLIRREIGHDPSRLLIVARTRRSGEPSRTASPARLAAPICRSGEPSRTASAARLAAPTGRRSGEPSRTLPSQVPLGSRHLLNLLLA